MTSASRLVRALLLVTTLLALRAAAETSPIRASPGADAPATVDPAYAAREPDASIPYITRGATALRLKLYKPAGWTPADRRPAVVLFFGGGFKGGGPGQFKGQLSRLARLGLVGFGPEYRTESSHGTTPVEAIRDGMAAVRYIRAHASELGVDPRRVVVGGGSAGGMLAAILATCPEVPEEPGADTSISYRPDALLLFNPGVKATPYTAEYLASVDPERRKQLEATTARFAPFAEAFSPIDNLRPGLPPTLIMIGTADPLLPFCRDYAAAARAAGNDCELREHPGAEHGFFNGPAHPKTGAANPHYLATLAEAEAFLARLGHLPAAAPAHAD